VDSTPILSTRVQIVVAFVVTMKGSRVLVVDHELSLGTGQAREGDGVESSCMWTP